MVLPQLMAIVGPTASGKSRLGIEIAKLIGGEILSVDSRQVYRGMNIGTAKVVSDEPGKRMDIMSVQELFGDRSVVADGIKHWGIDLVDPDQEFSVADFQTYGERKIKEILARGHVPILVGGTGLWLSALIDHYDLTQTPSDVTLRQELVSRPSGDLFAEYQRLDPDGAKHIDRHNTRRLVRALEVVRLTGKPFFAQQRKGPSKYQVLQIGLLIERETLNVRINDRVDGMIAQGLVREVRTLKDRYGCEIDAMTGIGYRQICAFLNNECTLAHAMEETKKATRQYAKRQMTWWKRDGRIVWVHDCVEAIDAVRSSSFNCRLTRNRVARNDRGDLEYLSVQFHQ